MVVEPAEEQVGEPVEPAPSAPVADRDHDRDRVGQQPPCDEPEQLVRRLVEPLGVVDDAEQRALLGDAAQEAEHRQSDEEPVGRLARRQAERDGERVPLRSRERVKAVEQRRAELMDPRERQLHLGLGARDLLDAERDRLPGRVPQQRRLADPGLAADDTTPLRPFRASPSSRSSRSRSSARPRSPGAGRAAMVGGEPDPNPSHRGCRRDGPGHPSSR